ncbi:Pentraxin-related protein PTX3 [Dissostichus eleginoides]|uniref:Pentraxin-related protein PTX3 n=1 Tax=Dissostichus eleginoides TaxID=100907 RepID=A0AAD9CDK4_DISEL|nr:Pentraxin-related protein PTX3 [Dissostichus eleginoides]
MIHLTKTPHIMFRWTLPQAVCVLSACVCLVFTYEDDFEVNYTDTFYNEIGESETPEPTPTPVPCSSRDLTKWDKLFKMLENSQMRENMMLQYADDIIKVEMGSLRGEMLRFVAQYGGSCGVAAETAGRRMALQLEGRLKETMERLKTRDQTSARNSAGTSDHLDERLQQLLSATLLQATRLAKMEHSCLRNGPRTGMGMDVKTVSKLPEAAGNEHQEQQVPSREGALDGLLAALQQTREELGEVLSSSRQRQLPAGCEMALLFPMRSPDRRVSNRTVLFSYGNRRNPYEIQLLLGQSSALFTIGGETHLVEARGVVSGSEWIHLCGAWTSQQGLATLWAGGKKVTSTPGVAEGHVIPDGGSLQLGQERNGCCPLTPGGSSGVAGFEEGFDPKLAFAGKMTGVNMWDRVLSEGEITQLALREGQGCEQRGNVVAWGATEMVPHGGAQFVN